MTEADEMRRYIASLGAEAPEASDDDEDPDPESAREPACVKQSLNERQQRFVEAMLTAPTVAAAAVQAGYSPETASQSGYRLLRRADVSAELEDLREQRRKATVVTAARVTDELACLAFFDPAEIAMIGTIQDLAKLPDHVRRAVTGWRVDRDGRLQVETAKPKALELLGRTLSMFRDRSDITVGPTLEELICGAGRDVGLGVSGVSVEDRENDEAEDSLFE